MRIKQILKEKNMTVQELADRMGVSRQALSRQISGKLLVETARSIASTLDVPLWQLFASAEDVTDNNVCPHCGKPINIKIEKA